MSSLAINTIFEIFSKIFRGWKSDNIESSNSVANMLKTNDDVLLFDKTIHEMKKNNEKTRQITLSDNRKVEISLK